MTIFLSVTVVLKEMQRKPVIDALTEWERDISGWGLIPNEGDWVEVLDGWMSLKVGTVQFSARGSCTVRLGTMWLNDEELDRWRTEAVKAGWRT